MTPQAHIPPLHPVSAPRSAETVAVALDALAYLITLPPDTRAALPEPLRTWLAQAHAPHSDHALRLDEARRLRTGVHLYLPFPNP